MAEFGWAYVAGGAITGALGPTGSVLLKKGDTQISGSPNLAFNTTSNTLEITGDISSSANVSASAFYGDGSNLTGITSVNIANDGNNRVLTADGDGTMSAESNLTFNGSNLILSGNLEVSGSLFVNELVTNVTSKNVTNISVNGSTAFGDTADDKHLFTGKIGVGTTTPEATLHLQSGSAGSIAAIGGAILVLESNEKPKIHLQSPGGYGGSIIFGSPTDNDEGQIDYDHGSDRFLFKTGGNTKMAILGDNVGVGTASPTKKLDVAGDIKSTGAITGSKMNLTGLSAGTATTSSYLALDSSNNVVLTSSSGGSGGTIGAAEDGSYSDGLYTDFVSSTPVGTAIDRFNEVLKILAPSPAPALSRINFDNATGSTVKLSFGVGNVLSDYTSSNTAAGFSAVAVSQSYAAATSGNNFRLGAYKDNTDITGFLNFHVTKVVQNTYLAYSTDAFGNAETGTLKLEVNGNVIHSVNLASLVGAGNPFTGSANSLTGDSGFTNVSVTASSFDGNNAEWYIFKHRTAKFKVDVNNMVPGWNYARVIHTVASTDNATNYVEWINDPSGAVNDLSVANGRIEDITLVGSKYLSGVQYNTDVTAKYKVNVNNLYRNVYAASGTPISFAVTNSTTPSAQSVPDINTGAGEDHTKVLGVTASLDYNGNSLVNGAITANVTVSHPFKSTISTTGSATTGNGFLIDNRTLSSTNTIENFHDETYRKTSGSYDNQASVTAGAATWNSQTHMTGSNVDGHQDGLLLFNQALYSPIDGDIPAGGNFSSLANVSSGQPNYSSTSGTRTFFRVLSNSSGADLYNFKIESTLNGTTYNNSSLGTGNVHLYAKIPGKTGWMDVSQAFTYGSVSDGNGALVSAASDSDTHVVTFGTASVAANDHIMLKIEADASWTGYILQHAFTVPANQAQATPQVLSDIDANDTGIAAKLSFGTSNAVAGYSNATGSSISLSNFNSNDNYTVSGNRRGIFSSHPTLDGELNDAIGAGSGYPADAFFNGYSGSLVLEVNGSEVHSVNLASTLNAISNNFNGNSSGFDLSAVAFSTLSNIPHYTKPYRTGTYQIGAGDQNSGWNYARIIHRTSGDQTTNYVEWIVDPSGSTNDSAVSTPVLSDFDHNDKYYQSGIGYFASRPSASFSFTGSNFYKNVYSNDSNAITFPTTTNCSISNIRIAGSGVTTFNSAVSSTSMPALNNSSDCEAASIEITGTVLFDSLTSISGGLGLFTDHDVSVTGRVLHPFKTDRTTSTASKTSFMVYSGSIGSTNLNTNEYFGLETYRIVSGNYVSQSNATSSANTWNSSTAMNGANAHGDGMVTVNGYAISPFKIGKAGDTRNNAQGSTGLQAPAGNPNYSALSENVRTYYRYFQNNSGLAKATFTLTLYGDANLISKSGAFYTGSLGANKNIQVELKVPFDPSFTGLDDTSTAWADCIKPYGVGTQPDTNGVGIFNGGGSDLTQTVGGSGRAIALQLQGKQVRANQYFVVKISAHKDWTGYLSRIQVTY